MYNPMSPRMVRMLKWLAQHNITVDDLKLANQITLRGLALRGYVGRGGITQAGIDAIADYHRSEFIARKAENKDLSDGVSAALALVRMSRAKVA